MNTHRWKLAAAHGVGLWETVSRGATYNPLSPGVVLNPYKAYGTLRRRSPVHRSAILRSWVLTRYEDVVATVRARGGSPTTRLARTDCERAPTGPGRLQHPAHGSARPLAAATGGLQRFREGAPSVAERGHRAHRGRTRRAGGGARHRRLDRRSGGASVNVRDVEADRNPGPRARPLGGMGTATRAPARDDRDTSRTQNRASRGGGDATPLHGSAAVPAGVGRDDATSVFASLVAAGDEISMAEAADPATA